MVKSRYYHHTFPKQYSDDADDASRVSTKEKKPLMSTTTTTSSSTNLRQENNYNTNEKDTAMSSKKRQRISGATAFTGGIIVTAVMSSFSRYPSLLANYDFSSSSIYSTATTTTATSNSSRNNDYLIDEDGCGLIDNTTKNRADWVPYDDEDTQFFHLVEPCVGRLWYRPFGAVNTSTLEKISCLRDDDHDEPPRSISRRAGSEENVRTTLGHYDRVLFIGDSVLAQQFLSLVCSLNPRITMKDIEQGTAGLRHMQYQFQHKNDAASSSSEYKTTTLTYRQVGRLFRNDQQGFFQDFYPKAVATFTNTDAIVLNAGLHYHSPAADHLQRTVRHIAVQSQYTNATVLLMEPTNAEWATRSGTFTKVCMFKCMCEAITNERLDGRGALSGTANYSEAEASQPHAATFAQLYPEPYQQQQWWGNNDSSCIPDCLPASWRSDLVRDTLQKVRRNLTASARRKVLTLVPVFWQLVALGSKIKQASSIQVQGDCVHKDGKSLLFMDSQLLRYMRQLQRERGER